jgi:iron complex transport system ATP-binding protein
MGAHLHAEALSCAAGRTTVLRGIDLEVRHGEVIGVVGPNGSGKSTLLRTLAGINAPVGGQVRVEGEPVDQLSSRRRARRVAFVGQDEQPSADLLVGELVALGLVPHRPPWAGGGATERSEVVRALREVNLADAVDRPVDQLSGGERRRAVLARGLAQRAGLLVLDEPTNDLDVRHQLALLDLIRSLGRTVVIALHELNLAGQYCDRLVVLHAGRARPAKPPSRALTPDVVAEVFGVDAVPVTHPYTGTTHLLFGTAGIAR